MDAGLFVYRGWAGSAGLGREGAGLALSGLRLASGWRPEPPAWRAGWGETLALSDSRLTGTRGMGAVGFQFRELVALATRVEQTRLVAQGVELHLFIAGQNASMYCSEFVIRRIASGKPEN